MTAAPDLCILTCLDCEHGGDPHALRIAVDRDDAARMLAQAECGEAEGLDASAIGRYVTVTDHSTGKRYRVAWHPCGAGCRCAVVAIEEPVAEKTGGRHAIANDHDDTMTPHSSSPSLRDSAGVSR